jgi:hypothetical protein
VPIVTPYKGLFFAEQKIAPQDFSVIRAEEAVRTTFGVHARIDHPRSSADETLIFDYDGPRYLLAIIVGDLNIGRAFLQELYARTAFSNIARISDPSAYRGGTVVLPAIEVFPSTVPDQAYTSCEQEHDVRGRIVGGLVNCRIEKPNDLHLSCGKAAQTQLQVASSSSTDSMHLRLIAPVKFLTSGGQMVRTIDVASTHKLSSPILLGVSCGESTHVSCGSSEAITELATIADFNAAATSIVSGQTIGAKYAQSISTRSPANEPEKVYGLGDLLQNFYRRQLPEGKSTFATLEICQD